MNANQSGFVLVSTIWLTLIMLVFAGLFNSYASDYLDAAIVSKARLKSTLDEVAQEHTLMFLFATHSASRRGLELANDGFLRLDGTEYRGSQHTYYRVNDYSGLVGLNTENSYHLENLLRFFESSGIQRQSLLAGLRDYIDQDELASLSGKEAPAYRVAGLDVPPNDYLRTTVELNKVFGWQAWLSEHPDVKLEWLSTNWRTRVNINAIPESLLRKVLPLSDQDRDLLIESRQREPFRSMSDLNKSLRLRSSLDEDFFTFVPSGDVKFRIYSANDSKLTTLAVRFTPMNLEAPWQIDYRYQGERNFDIPKTAETAPQKDLGW
ncbi:MAG: general secretion pathway protein GspK [Pseudomonadales bacterium]|nr:general secretion pathway protein GspK [Pseudomonadales bacterium]